MEIGRPEVTAVAARHAVRHELSNAVEMRGVQLKLHEHSGKADNAIE